MNIRSLIAAAAALVVSSVPAFAGPGVNVGSLTCKINGGMGYVFGSSKTMSCVFTRADGSVETYNGQFNKYGLDLGFTKEAHMFWLVFAPGNVAPGALAGGYGGATADVAIGYGLGANAMLGGGNGQIALQPLSVDGSVGFNVAAGIAQMTLRSGI